MKIIADKNIPYLKGLVEQYGETSYLAGSDFTREAIRDADTLIVRTVTNFNQSLLEGSKVKLICSATIGYDHIDVDYCKAHNIHWTNAPGCNSGSVQQYITSVLLILAQQQKLDLSSLCIGIVGAGNVGVKVAKFCRLLGMKVLLNDPPRQEIEPENVDFVSLGQIKEEADIITFHTPLNKSGKYKTYHLADVSFFESLKRKPYIINSARGGIVDTTAIKFALEKELIKGAFVDCWENEPSIDLSYLNMVNLGTPHIAGYSADGKANATRMSLESIAKFWNLDESIANQVRPKLIGDPIIDLNHYGMNKTDRLYGALLETYNPMNDFRRLMLNPSSFKDLRNTYPLRRENIAYTIKNATENEVALYKEFGFCVLG